MIVKESKLIEMAVKLADGWDLEPCYYFSGYRILTPFGIKQHTEEIYPEYLDALAAQLVRQVDALESYSVYVTDRFSCVIYLQTEHHKVLGPDRTMNTLRAIVESGVLDD